MCLSISSAHLGVQQKGRNLINTIFAMCNLKTAFRHNRAYVTWLWHKTVMDFKHTGQTCPLPPQSLPPRQSSIQVASASISSADLVACWLQLISRSLIANAQIGSLIAVDLPRRACHTTFQRASPCHARTPSKILDFEPDRQCLVTKLVTRLGNTPTIWCYYIHRLWQSVQKAWNRLGTLRHAGWLWSPLASLRKFDGPLCG